MCACDIGSSQRRIDVNLAVHFSSVKNEWETPPELFAKWDRLFHFELDVCATSQNTKCVRYFTPEDDGLSQSWAHYVCWMNPPYGRKIITWVHKAYEESLRGATVVCLLPARTDTRWWHEYCMKGEIIFLRGRLKFVGAPHSATFPSAIVIFRPPGVTLAI